MPRLELTCLLLRLRRRAVAEDGVVALATFAFMVTLGMVAIVTLWSIGYATGAYNQLYSATQTAAYAAASETTGSGSGASQLTIECGANTGAAICGDNDNGAALLLVHQVLDESFPNPGNGATGGFGLAYGLSGNSPSAGNTVYLVDRSGNSSDSFETWNMSFASGFASELHEALGSPSCPAYDAFNRLVCWSVIGDTGVRTLAQYETGVVVRTKSQVQLRGCFICGSVSLDIVASAKVSQPDPGT